MYIMKNWKMYRCYHKTRKSFDSDISSKLYDALIFPHVSYGIWVRGTAASIHLHRLYVPQETFVRVICGVHPRTHTDRLFLNMYFEVFSEIRFRKHPSQSSIYFNGAEYFLSSTYLFLRVCGICFVWLMGQCWPLSVNKNYHHYYYYYYYYYYY